MNIFNFMRVESVPEIKLMSIININMLHKRFSA